MTLQRNRTYLTKDINLDGETYGVFYYPKEGTVFSATRAYRFIAVFDSLPIVPSNGIITWKELTLFGTMPSDSGVKIYIKSAQSMDDLNSAIWSGPYLNGISGEDISSITGEILLIRILIDSFSNELDSAPIPIIDKMVVTATATGTEGKLFTKTFDLGFVPKHIVLTYNGDEIDSSLFEFALAGKDSVVNSDYQKIIPNKIMKLDELPELANKIKLMVKATGSNETPFKIDCFSFLIGGEGKKQLNQ